MPKQQSILRRDVIGWSLYDFANTIFSMNILSLYFKRWVVEDLQRDGLYYDLAYAGAMLLTALFMPALGALSDHTGKKRLFLFLFTVSCCIAIGIVPLVPESLIVVIMLAFAIATFCYEGGMVFYNALLYSVSDGNEARYVSGFGVAMGYLGSIAGMILVLPWVTGGLFGLNIPWHDAGGKVAAFVPSAVLFMVFAIPVFIWVKEKPGLVKDRRIPFMKSYAEVWAGIKDTRRYPGVLRFLIADYFFEDAVATVILNIGIFSSIVIGLSDADLTVFLIISTTFAMIGSMLIGHISKRASLKKTMATIVWGWVIVLLFFIFIEHIILIYCLGCLVGILLGGLWTVSRPLLAEMVPKDELGRFFGLYSLSGRAAAVIGPVVWGGVVYIFNPSRSGGRFLSDLMGISESAADKLPYRLAVLSLLAMMMIGLVIFRKLPEHGAEG
ncbi:MAG: MFS transporter [candidate division Zixibacteria bacterium]|nr:MFS transporter [candidate division Zixibacteria bacterium]